MPVSYSTKRTRDATLISAWRGLPADRLPALGLTLEQIEAAQRKMVGRILTPDDPDYDSARMIANPVFDAFPQAILMCETEGDVAVGLWLSQFSNLPFTVRSGGHCTAGFCAGPGLLIDVSGLDGVFVNVAAQTATVGPGCKFGNLFSSLDGYGLHVPGGECPDVCVGGYVQGGGYGFTSVTFGMNCDNVLEMTVMLADGAVVLASPTVNADLWWAMRGGTGGNFGVLLSVTYQLRPLGPVFGWALAWPLDSLTGVAQTADAMMLLQRDYMLTSAYAPRMNIQVSLCYQTQMDPAVPPPPTATPAPYLMVRGLYVGEAAAGIAAIAPLQALPGCIVQWTKIDSFLKMNELLLNYPQSMPLITEVPYEDKTSHFVSRDLSLSEWTEILLYFKEKGPNNRCYGYLEFYGGAINSYDIGRSAYIHRSSAYNAVMDVFWTRPDEHSSAEKFLAGWRDLMERIWNHESYQNYPNLRPSDYVAHYWGAAASALSVVKQKYDPAHRFTFLQEVPPPSPGSIKASTDPRMAFVASALERPIEYLSRRYVETTGAA